MHNVHAQFSLTPLLPKESPAALDLMPGHLVANPRRAACAYALQKAGHQVTVLEKSDGKTWSRGGLRCPPNMTRLLNQWGLKPLLEKVGQRCTQFVFQKGESGELIAVMKLHEEFLKDLMADFVFIQHGDLHSMLCDQGIDQGVQFRYNCKAMHIDSETLSVTLESGERVISDMIIGADGFNSLVRTSVLGKQILENREKDVTLNFTIPIESMRKEEDLRTLTEGSDWAIWLGDQYQLHGSVVNTGRDFSVTLGYTLPADAPELNEEWRDTYPLEYFNLDFTKFEPRVRKLLKMAKEITPHIYIKRPHLENYVCDRARVVLIGEAAHPMLPSGHHNTALGIEDAQTLGSLFSGIRAHDQVPQLLSAYEELRQTRCVITEDCEKRRRVLLTLPRGEQQEQRDLRLKKAMACKEWDHMDEKTFRAIWGDEMDLLMYDASEKVEDWWTKWGPLLVRGDPNRRDIAPNLLVSISKDR